MADEKEKKATKRPTAQKRDIRNEKRHLINKAFKSKVRSAQRDFVESLKGNDKEVANASLSAFYSLMDKGVKRGVFTVNKASRTKMRAQKKLASFAS